MVTSSEDGTVKVWDTRTGSLQRNYNHRIPVNDVVIHPNQGELISGDRAGIVRVWDLGESICTHQLIPEDDVAVHSVSVASDGSLLTAGNKRVLLFTAFLFLVIEGADGLTCNLTGERLHLAHGSRCRVDSHYPYLHIPGPQGLPHSSPVVTGCQAPCYMLGRPHSKSLEP